MILGFYGGFEVRSLRRSMSFGFNGGFQRSASLGSTVGSSSVWEAELLAVDFGISKALESGIREAEIMCLSRHG